MEGGRAADRPQRHTAWFRWLPAGLGAAALIALAMAGTLLVWNRAETVSAETLLDRAQGPANVSTYHLLMTRQTPAKGDQSLITEVWFGGADHQRSVEKTLDAGGVTVATQEVVFDGPQTWIATTKSGQTHVVHTTGTTWTKPADDPSPESNLTDMLVKYSQNKPCLSAQLQGEATTAGRASYLISVTPRPGACAASIPVGDYGAGRIRQVTSGGQYVGQMQVWLDQQTFLLLKTEMRDAAGTLLDRMEVTRIDYGVPMADATFTYTPPADAHISTFTGGTGADVKRALNPDPMDKPVKTGR
jgi:outer membrane lipoprotein-sorting protein